MKRRSVGERRMKDKVERKDQKDRRRCYSRTVEAAAQSHKHQAKYIFNKPLIFRAAQPSSHLRMQSSIPGFCGGAPARGKAPRHRTERGCNTSQRKITKR